MAGRGKVSGGGVVTIRRVLVPVLALLLARETVAAECPTAEDLLDSPLFETFGEWLEEAYGGPSALDLRDEIAVAGQGLGRVAAAVGGDPQRATILACLELAIEQAIAGIDEEGVTPGEARRRLVAAARGDHDESVARATGVRDTTPAESYFARLAPWGRGGPPPARPSWSIPATTTGPPPAISAGLQAGVRFQGFEYRVLELERPELELCRAACVDDIRCSTFNYIAPRDAAQPGRCVLGARPGEAMADPCCTVGVVRPPHPWAELCTEDIAALGHRPVFVHITPGRQETVFVDPFDGALVAIDSCVMRLWDQERFEADHELVEVEAYAPDGHERFHRLELWRWRDGEGTARIGHYRR
jgi:hypothetical protein